MARHENSSDVEIHGCGWSWFSPHWLRRLAVFRVFMFILSINATIQGMVVNGFVSISISSIEKRFNLSSTKSGIFSATYDVAVVLMLIPLSYYAQRVNKVRCIGYGMFMVGLGALLLVLPHFIDGRYVVGMLKSDHCDHSRMKSDGHQQTTSNYSYPVILLSQLLIGFGAAPLFTYGYSTIDEFDSHKRTAINMAIFMGVSTVGPALAFIGGGFLLQIWGDIGKSNYTDLGITGPSDPRWYGAWWIGFTATGIFSFFTALPLCLFPQKLNDTERRKKDDIVQTHLKLNIDFTGDRLAYFKVFKMFTFNKTCMALIAMQTAESCIMNGYITFIPKLFENMFGYSSSWASTMTGIIAVPMGVLGSLIGGKLSEKVENQFRPVMKICLALVVMMMISSFSLLLKCPQLPIAGVTHEYDSYSAGDISLTNLCNANCYCDDIFNPICSTESHVSYISPCHAGCTTAVGNSSSVSSCYCASIYNVTDGIIKKGWCEVPCQMVQIIFFCMFSLLILSVFALAPMIQSTAMRVVSFHHRDAYICFGWMFMRLFGSIPGAVIFGTVIDSTCLHWIVGSENTSKCVLYDASNLGYYIFLFTIIIKALCFICLLVAMKSYVPIQCDTSKATQKDSFHCHLSVLTKSSDTVNEK